MNPSAARTSSASRCFVASDFVTLQRELVALIPELRRRATRLSHDPILAEDLVQDTLVRALKFAGQHEQGTNVRAWAFQILFSVFVTRYRRLRRDKRARSLLRLDPCAWTVPSSFGAPDSGVSLTSKTQRELDALPPSFRVVIELVDLRDLSYREAAAHLGVPVGTVMSRVHRGRKLLSAQLAEAA
jgi:RNA polymerase sigma-70 factor (ECF subfamily)